MVTMENINELEQEPLSYDNPVDWQYSECNGFVDRVCFSFWRDYMQSHNLVIELWDVSFQDGAPLVKCDGVSIEVMDSSVDSGYAKLDLKNVADAPEICEVVFYFNCNFYFSLSEIESDGSLNELFYDDFRDQ